MNSRTNWLEANVGRACGSAMKAYAFVRRTAGVRHAAERLSSPRSTRDSLRCDVEALVVELNFELDFVAGDRALVGEFAERPVRGERDFVAIDSAVLNWRFVL